MALTWEQLVQLLTPDGSGNLSVAAASLETPAVSTLWDAVFSNGTLVMSGAVMSSDAVTQTVTVSGNIGAGVFPGVQQGVITASTFVLSDGTVAARIPLAVNDKKWNPSTSFPVIAGSVIDAFTFTSPSFVIDSSAPEKLPEDFRSSFGYPPDLPQVAAALIPGLTFSSPSVTVNAALALILDPEINFPTPLSGPLSVYRFAGDEFAPATLYPEMLLNAPASNGKSYNLIGNSFVFGLQLAVIFQEIQGDPEIDFAIIPTSTVALRCAFTPSGWAAIPVSMYIYDQLASAIELEVGQPPYQQGNLEQLTQLLNGASIEPLLAPAQALGFPLFDQVELTFVGTHLTLKPSFAFENILVVFTIGPEGWDVLNGLIHINGIQLSVYASGGGGGWTAGGSVYASAVFDPSNAHNASITMEAFVSLPQLYFQVGLKAEFEDGDEVQAVDLKSVTQSLVGDSINMPSITGASFEITGNVATSSYTFSAEVVEHWELIGGANGLVLTGMSLKLASDRAGVSGNVGGTFTLGGVGIEVNAGYSSDIGWVFSGATLPGQKPSLTNLIVQLIEWFGFERPEGMPEIDLDRLSVEYQLQQNRMLLDTVLSFDGVSINLTDLPLVGPYLPDDLSIVLNTVSLNIDTKNEVTQKSLTTISIGLTFAGKPEVITLSFGAQPPPEPVPALREALPNERAVALPGGVMAAEVPGVDANSQAGTWFNVQRTFGPVSVQRIGFRIQGDGLEVLFDASLAISAFSVSVLGLGLTIPLKSPYWPSADISGLGISYTTPSLKISGAFMKTPKKEYTEFAGQLLVRFGNFGLSAIGAYATSDPPSMFAFLMVNAPLGGPPFFYLNGIAAGFGYNRDLLLPPINQVTTFPLVAGAVSGPSNPFGPKPSLADAQQVMNAYLGLAIGQNWIAAGVSVSSFGMVNVFALLTVTFGTRLQFGLLGVGTLSVPALSPSPVVFAQLALKAVFTPEDGSVAAYAQLTENSYVLDRNCHITGGFAFCLWFSPNEHGGDFVITFGGYNPHFSEKPAWYPDVPRLGMSWQVSSLLSIKGGEYFALTPNAVMAGGYLNATWNSGPFSVWFNIHADFIIYWKPFHYDIEMGVSFGVRASLKIAFVRINLNVSVGANLHLWGPPFRYRAEIDLDIVSFTIGDDDDSKETKPIGWTDFKNSFLDTTAPESIAAKGSLTRGNRRSDAPLYSRRLRESDTIVAIPDQPCTQAVLDVRDASPSVLIVLTGGVLQDLTQDNVNIEVHPDPQDPSFKVPVPLDYIADPQTFGLRTQTLVPAKVLTWNGESHQGSWPDGSSWNVDFGIGPMYLDPLAVRSEHSVTVCKLNDCKLYNRFITTPSIGPAAKGLWLYQKNLSRELNSPQLLDDLLQGLTLEPRIDDPDHSLPINVENLIYEKEGEVAVIWGINPAPTTDPFGGLNPTITYAATIGDPQVADQRNQILTDMIYNGFTISSVLDTKPVENPEKLWLLSPYVLSYLGERKTFKKEEV